MASILLRMDEGQREAIRAAALKAGVKMAPWALDTLMRAASGTGPDPSAKLGAARAALAAGERQAAPLARPPSKEGAAPAIAVRCSRHKRLACPACPP